MNLSTTTSLLFQNRHPERSEVLRTAVSFSEALLHCAAASAVEGPGPFDSVMPAADLFPSTQGYFRRFLVTMPSGLPTTAFLPGRSFDFGSAGLNGKTHLPLAFAQDDGALISWVDFPEACSGLVGSISVVAVALRATDLEGPAPAGPRTTRRSSLQGSPRRPACDGYQTAPPPRVRRLPEQRP